SYQVWAKRLSQYADSNEFLNKRAYWAQLEKREPVPVIKDFPTAENRVNDVEFPSFSLSKEETGQLLKEVNSAFNTEINDILLAALGLGVKEAWGRDDLLIALEGHGREEIFSDVDIKRTVGWFTSIYPVLLDMSVTDDLSHYLKYVKENLRRIPDKGIGYGILKYLTAEKNKKAIIFALAPQVSFNYLGQLDREAGEGEFEVTGAPVGNQISLRAQRPYELDILGAVVEGRLTISIHYNRNQYKEETMQRLLEENEKQLRKIIAYCVGR
ncbi:MAG: non-ribosomal peptide synthetase, partial [bacterium]|nr:non-ribosomal peptide synthetase [bacterium]